MLRPVQSRAESIFEVCLSIAVGYIIATLGAYLILPVFGFAASLADSALMSIFFTALSIARAYLLRRLFERGLARVLVNRFESIRSSFGRFDSNRYPPKPNA